MARFCLSTPSCAACSTHPRRQVRTSRRKSWLPALFRCSWRRAPLGAPCRPRRTFCLSGGWRSVGHGYSPSAKTHLQKLASHIHANEVVPLFVLEKDRVYLLRRLAGDILGAEAP